MTEKSKGHVAGRGLLWAGGLAAIPLPPTAAFDHRGVLPWEKELSVGKQRPPCVKKDDEKSPK